MTNSLSFWLTDGPHPLEMANTSGKGLSLEVSTPGLTRPERRDDARSR